VALVTHLPQPASPRTITKTPSFLITSGGFFFAALQNNG